MAVSTMIIMLIMIMMLYAGHCHILFSISFRSCLIQVHLKLQWVACRSVALSLCRFVEFSLLRRYLRTQPSPATTISIVVASVYCVRGSQETKTIKTTTSRENGLVTCFDCFLLLFLVVVAVFVVVLCFKENMFASQLCWW